MIVELWHHVGLYAIIFLTNLQLLDGASTRRRRSTAPAAGSACCYVTIPQLRPAIAVNTVYALIEFLKTFTVIMVMTKGGPNFATNFVSYYAYTSSTSRSMARRRRWRRSCSLAVFVIAAAAPTGGSTGATER